MTRTLSNCWSDTVTSGYPVSLRSIPATPFLVEVVFESMPFRVVHDGVGLGSVIAVVCSWQRNRSVLAGLLSWIYVIYFGLTRRPDETRGG